MITAWKWSPSFLPKNGGAMYGWFFWLWMAIMVLECVLLLRVAAKHNKKTTDKVIFSYGLILTLAEVYKQVFFTIERGGDYPWHLFPWQFCSVPMFVALIAPLVRNERVKDAMYKFLSFFGLIAGIMTLIIPEGLYWDYITITCHSFFWHTSIVIIALYLIVANGYAKTIKVFLREMLAAAIVYAAAIGIALLLDVVWWFFIRAHVPAGASFNMFYISPFFNSSLPVFRDIQPAVPYPVFLFLYILGFCLGTASMWFAAFGIRKLFRKR